MATNRELQEKVKEQNEEIENLNALVIAKDERILALEEELEIKEMSLNRTTEKKVSIVQKRKHILIR